MVSFEPVDVDYNKIGDEDFKWDDDVIKDLELRFNNLREFDETLNESTDEDTIEMTENQRCVKAWHYRIGCKSNIR